MAKPKYLVTLTLTDSTEYSLGCKALTAREVKAIILAELGVEHTTLVPSKVKVTIA